MKIRIALTKKDADIAAFKKSLPQGEWSENVALILTCAIRDRVADIPMQFAIEPLDKAIQTKISLPDKLAERFCEKFGYKKGSVTTGIKTEIRKCIRKNLKAPPVKRFSSAEIAEAFDKVFHRVNEKAAKLDGVRERYKLVHKEYGRSFHFMLDSLTVQLRKEDQK